MYEIIIGNQVWADSNLNVTKFSNGDKIFQATCADEWVRALKNKQPAWCFYNYDENQGLKYGKLYNWYAVYDSRGIAPKGWRIPSSEDFISLVNLVKIENLTNLKSEDLWNYEFLYEMREIDQVDIEVHQDGGKGTNVLGFNGKPSGRCDDKGIFNDLNHFTFFWTKTDVIFNSLNNINQNEQNLDFISISREKKDEYLLENSNNQEEEKNKQNLVFVFSLQCFTAYNEIKDQSVEETTFLAASKTSGFSIRCIKIDSKISEKESIISSIKLNNDFYRDLPEVYKNDRDIVCEIVKNNGRFLQYLTSNFTSNKEIVLLAVKNFGMSLRYASNNLKNDREVVLEAVKKSYRALRFSNEQFYDDLEIISIAVKISGKAFVFASERLRNNIEIVSEAVKTYGLALEYASEELRNVRSIVLTAVKKNGLALKYASINLQNDREIVLAAINNNGSALKFASISLTKDREIVYEAVKKDGSALDFASDLLKNDLIIVESSITFYYPTLKFVSESLKKNRDLVLKFVNKNGSNLEYATNEFQNDREIVYQAISFSGDGELFRFASDDLKNDILIAFIAFKYSRRVDKFLIDISKNHLIEFENKYGHLINLDFLLIDL